MHIDTKASKFFPYYDAKYKLNLFSEKYNECLIFLNIVFDIFECEYKSRLYCYEGDINLILDKYEDALKSYENAIQADDKNGSAYLNDFLTTLKFIERF